MEGITNGSVPLWNFQIKNLMIFFLQNKNFTPYKIRQIPHPFWNFLFPLWWGYGFQSVITH